MNVTDVMGEVADALRTIDALQGRTLDWDAAQVNPDAAIVDLPESGAYDVEAYGADMIMLSFMVVVGRINDRSSARRLAGYVSRSGSSSVKAAVDGHTYTSCDVVTVKRFDTKVATFGQVQYLAAEFTAEVLAKGG